MPGRESFTRFGFGRHNSVKLLSTSGCSFFLSLFERCCSLSSWSPHGCVIVAFPLCTVTVTVSSTSSLSLSGDPGIVLLMRLVASPLLRGGSGQCALVPWIITITGALLMMMNHPTRMMMRENLNKAVRVRVRVSSSTFEWPRHDCSTRTTERCSSVSLDTCPSKSAGVGRERCGCKTKLTGRTG